MASGDVALTSPVTKVINNLAFYRCIIDRNSMTVIFQDDLGQFWAATVTDGACIGFDFGGGIRDIALTKATALTNARTNLIKLGGIKALVQGLITDGVTIVAGTVG